MTEIILTGPKAKNLRMALHEDLPEGLTLQYLADKIGVTQGMLSLFENGKRNLSPEAMQRLQRAFDDAVTRAIRAKEKKQRDEREKQEFEARQRNLIATQFPATGSSLSANIHKWAVAGRKRELDLMT